MLQLGNKKARVGAGFFEEITNTSVSKVIVMCHLFAHQKLLLRYKG